MMAKKISKILFMVNHFLLYNTPVFYRTSPHPLKLMVNHLLCLVNSIGVFGEYERYSLSDSLSL